MSRIFMCKTVRDHRVPRYIWWGQNGVMLQHVVLCGVWWRIVVKKTQFVAWVFAAAICCACAVILNGPSSCKSSANWPKSAHSLHFFKSTIGHNPVEKFREESWDDLPDPYVGDGQRFFPNIS